VGDLIFFMSPGGLKVNVELISILHYPPPYPAPPRPLFGSVPSPASKIVFVLLVSISLRGKVCLSKALSRTNPSALDLVLALAPVALVLGIIFEGLIEFRFFNWSFKVWKETSF